MQNKKIPAVFLLGMCSGAVLILLCTGFFLKTFLIEEYKSEVPYKRFIMEFPDKIMELQPAWSVNRDHCMIPVVGKPGQERQLSVYRLCNKEYAMAMLEQVETRRISAILPCSFAVYETADGGTGLARLNTTFAAWLVGGVPASIFSERIAPFQEKLLNSFNFKEIR